MIIAAEMAKSHVLILHQMMECVKNAKFSKAQTKVLSFQDFSEEYYTKLNLRAVYANPGI